MLGRELSLLTTRASSSKLGDRLAACSDHEPLGCRRGSKVI